MGSLGFQELILLIVLVGMVTPYIFFLLTLQKTLKAIRPAYRKMEPGVVWVLLVPFIGGILLFFVADAIGTGFKNEFDRYAVFKQNKPTYGLGVTLAALHCIYFVAGFFNIPLLMGLIAIAVLATWIVYWVQVNKMKNELLRLKTTFNLEPGEQSIFV